MDNPFRIDEYTLKTRVIPACIALFPYFYVIHSAEMSIAALINSLFISGVLLLILSHLAREMGVDKQKELFAQWGGKPTTMVLRHRDETLPRPLKRHYHQILGTVFDQKLPTEAFELANGEDADAIYAGYIQWLQDNTKDRKKYGTLWQSTISYGFWRNLLALKTIGIGTAILALFITVGAFMLANAGWYRLDVRMLLTPIASFIAIVGWLKFVTHEVVEKAAYNYARSLLAQCDAVADSHQRPR